MTQIVLEAIGLGKKYQMGEVSVEALSGLDFKIAKGEFVAIMGPSGSGKSTLLHLLGGLDKPSEGEVKIAGQRLSILNDKQATLVRRHNIGFVFQFFNLLPTLTAEENIALPLLIDGKSIDQYQGRVNALLNLVGLTERRKHKPDQLSGGEQQRVALARALVTEPAILLADEPTGNLDSKNGTLIMELLQRSCQELDQAMIAVTHDARAATYANRVVFLRDGKIVHEMHFDDQQEKPERMSMVIKTFEELEVES